MGGFCGRVKSIFFRFLFAFFEIYFGQRGCSARLFSVFTFTFLVDRRGLFALIVETVTSGDAGALGVTEPWIFVGTVSAGLHVSGVGDVSNLERQRAFVAAVAGLLGGGRLLSAIPRVKGAQLLVLLRVGDPLKRLSCRHKPYVRPEMG
jgi:hypothetical protein